jgi:hypothetical protein
MGFNYVVGIDPSLTSTGFARIGKDVPILTKTFGTKPTFGPNPMRAFYIAKSILTNSTKNDLFMIEDYAYGKAMGAKKGQKSDSSMVTLAELGGILRLLIYRFTGRMPVPVATTTVKAYLGDGRMKKDFMPMAVYKRLAIDCKTHDEYVAAAIADLGAQCFFPSRDLFKYEQKAISLILKKISEN